MLIVQKYGGSSLADPQKIFNAAKRAVDRARQGAQVIVVVSAQADTTDTLITEVRRIDPNASFREQDMCLAVGEQFSAAVMAIAIGALDHPAVSLTGWQAGLQTDSVYGNARILALKGDRIQKELSRGNIVVVTGFQGVNELGDITTLGRGGSDTTAVALAAFLQADLCQIYTDVDGVYDRDPRKFTDAVKFERVGYGQMLELIGQGAQVLHDRSVEIARDHAIPIEVLSAFTGTPGTVVG